METPPLPLQLFTLREGLVSSTADQTLVDAFAADFQGLKHFGAKLGEALELGPPWTGTLQEEDFTLNFAYLPPRIATVDVPGKGKQTVWYMVYYVYNKTGKPRTVFPEFELVTKDPTGVLANFLSRPVLAGFTTGAAVMIAVGQFNMLLGTPKGTPLRDTFGSSYLPGVAVGFGSLLLLWAWMTVTSVATINPPAMVWDRWIVMSKIYLMLLVTLITALQRRFS